MIITNGVLQHVDPGDLSARGILRIPNGITNIKTNVGNNITGLKQIYLPESLKNIPEYVFCNNPGLVAIYFGRTIDSISNSAFSKCPNLQHIRMPDDWRNMYSWFRAATQNITSISQYDANNKLNKYKLCKYYNRYYHESDVRHIGQYSIHTLYRLNLFAPTTALFTPESEIGIRSGRQIFIHHKFEDAILHMRKHQINQEFEYAMRIYDITHPGNELKNLDWQTILRNAFQNSVYTQRHINVRFRNTARNWIKNINIYAKQLFDIEKKYPNVGPEFLELDTLSMDELIQIITPIKSQKSAVNQSCTRWLKRHPVTPDEMNAIVRAGYKNPGAFPYSWLIKIPQNCRGNATRRLHRIFKDFSVKLYSPQYYTDTDTELHNTACKISAIIKQPIDIKYLSVGNFAKTFTLQIPGDKKYVCKIYHSDRTYNLVKKYNHDTELQNSFLVGGRRYYGKTKFRKISTAGISNQRGEIYLIYPYTDPEPSQTRIYKPFEQTQWYILNDMNRDNYMGNTIIDIGALHINYDRWSQPQYVSKITNTVLYQSWNALGYVLNNYTISQINTAIDFISERVSARTCIDYTTIQKKLDFLRQKTR